MRNYNNDIIWKRLTFAILMPCKKFSPDLVHFVVRQVHLSSRFNQKNGINWTLDGRSPILPLWTQTSPLYYRYQDDIQVLHILLNQFELLFGYYTCFEYLEYLFGIEWSHWSEDQSGEWVISEVWQRASRRHSDNRRRPTRALAHWFIYSVRLCHTVCCSSLINYSNILKFVLF